MFVMRAALTSIYLDISVVEVLASVADVDDRVNSVGRLTLAN